MTSTPINDGSTVLYSTQTLALNKDEKRPQTGLSGSLFVLCSTALGAGILATAKVFSDSGIIISISLLITFGFLNALANWFILKSGEIGQVNSYEGMLQEAFPSFGRAMTTISFGISIFGALCAYLVIIIGIVNSIIITLNAPSAWYTSKEFLAILIIIFIIFPLTILRNISRLEYAAFASVFIIACLAIITVVYGARGIAMNRIEWKNVIITVPKELFGIVESATLLGGAFSCQTNIFPIWNELYQPTVRRMNTVQILQTIVALILYFSVGFFGYIQFPLRTNSDFLDEYPPNVFFLVVRVFFCIAIIFHYPVVHFGMRNSIEQTVFKNYKFSWIRHIVEAAIAIVASFLLAVTLQDLGTIIDLSFSISGYMVSFGFPAISYVRISYKHQVFLPLRKRLLSSPDYDDNNEDNTDDYEVSESNKLLISKRAFFAQKSIIAAILLFVFAVVMSVMSMYVTVRNHFLK